MLEPGLLTFHPIPALLGFPGPRSPDCKSTASPISGSGCELDSASETRSWEAEEGAVL